MQAEEAAGDAGAESRERRLEAQAHVAAAGYALLHSVTLRHAPRLVRSLTPHGMYPSAQLGEVCFQCCPRLGGLSRRRLRCGVRRRWRSSYIHMSGCTGVHRMHVARAGYGVRMCSNSSSRGELAGLDRHMLVAARKTPRGAAMCGGPRHDAFPHSSCIAEPLRAHAAPPARPMHALLIFNPCTAVRC